MTTSTTKRPPGAQRGRLNHSAVSQEVLDSSRSVLDPTRSGSLRGLQQFYSPREAAALIARVQGATQVTLDPTAGDGALLTSVMRQFRFGVEIDAEQIGDGSAYTAIRGDVQRVYPLLRTLGVQVPRIAANPPFGLDWTAPNGSTENSTVATWRMSHTLLADNGAGAFIAGRDRFCKDVLPRADASGVYAIVECDDLFDGVELPIVLAFFVKAGKRRPDTDVLRLSAGRTGLVELADRIVAARVQTCEPIGAGRYDDASRLRDVFEQVDKILEAERASSAGAETRFDAMLTGQRVSLRLSPWARLVLAQRHALRNVERLNRQNVAYFALNAKEWSLLAELAEEQVLTLDPRLVDRVAEVIDEAARLTCPLYPVRPQQRLAYLDDLDRITCIEDDPERGFEQGQSYALRTFSEVQTTKQSKVTHSRSGEVAVRKYEEEAKILVIDIDGKRFSERAEDVTYLVQHFHLPDPGDVGTRFPDVVRRNEDTLLKLAHDHGFTHKQFQREDLARLMTKGSGLLGWEQGLGKSLGGLSLVLASIEHGARRTGLIVCPQDLVEQWQREATTFFDLDLEHISTPQQAREVAQHLKRGGEGIYITHFEALSVVGRIDEALPETDFTHRVGSSTVRLSSDEHCPSCRESYQTGWQKHAPLVCAACGYVHKRLVVKPAAHHLAHAFARGVIVVDEGTLVKGNDSLRSKAIRGLRARHRYVLTGTPISNYVNDVFWLLWWALGNATAAFPYDYHGGRAKFENDFCVIEHMMGRGDKAHRRERRKVLPQVTNVSRLWRLLAGGMVRRRKEDTGEPLVERTLKTVTVPMGIAQQKLYKHWLSTDTFATFFAWKHPGHPLIEANLVEKFAAGIGQLQKLEYATTLPESDPDQWPGLDDLELSNWTPKNMKVVELALRHVQAGEKVLIGSCLIETGPWIAERLREHGVHAVHITEERNGRSQTLDPKKRAREIHEFRYGDAQVLCCGIPSVRLGHNLDTASVVIVDGLVFSYEMFDQFIARAHRLTSKKPVTVYVPIVRGSIDEAKWELLSKKAKAADLALDGQLVSEREEPVPLEQVLRDLQRAGIRSNGDEVSERDLRRSWIRNAPSRARTRRTTPTRTARPMPRTTRRRTVADSAQSLFVE